MLFLLSNMVNVSHIGSNLRFLREQKGITQKELADALDMSRVKYASYESGINKNLPISDLLHVSAYFRISIDTLLKVDLPKLSKSRYKELQAGNDTFVTGTKLRVLATTVDKNNNDNVEFVPIKAKAGYLNGYNDPEFITSLPSFQLPILKKDRKYRVFTVTGDSMLPFPENAYMIGEYIDNWNEIKDGDKCLVITLEQGFVLKEIYNNLKKNRTLLLKSTNPIYEPYEVPVEQIIEMWKFSGYIDLKWPQLPFSTNDVLSEIDLFKENIMKLNHGKPFNYR